MYFFVYFYNSESYKDLTIQNTDERSMVHVSFESTREGHYGFNGAFQRMNSGNEVPFEYTYIAFLLSLLTFTMEGVEN